MITDIENELSDYQEGTDEYNEKFIEKAYSLANDGAISSETLKNIGLNDFNKLNPNIVRLDKNKKALNILEKANTANKDRDLKIDYSTDITARDRIHYAKEFLGYKEEYSSADIFLYKWHSSSKEVGWCAGFVDYVLTKNPSADQTASWYTDITNTYWLVNVDNTAKAANALVEPQDAKAGDIIVFDYDKDNSMDHISLVVAVEGDKIITIDGNSGNMVRINETIINDPRRANIRICRA